MQFWGYHMSAKAWVGERETVQELWRPNTAAQCAWLIQNILVKQTSAAVIPNSSNCSDGATAPPAHAFCGDGWKKKVSSKPSQCSAIAMENARCQTGFPIASPVWTQLKQ